MQVVTAIGTVHIAGVAHISDDLSFFHCLPLADRNATHMGIQTVISVAVTGGAVTDLYAVAVTVYRAGGADYAGSHGVNGGTVGGGKVGTPVGDPQGSPSPNWVVMLL